ncbi:MAG: hypothetical protein P9C36_02835 [Defluviicoccus sp.]|nr:hypothetical protein [Defluviicoccus sp.]MDG4591544.1 hypothetical protein [Defluviicoccus sp.]
MAQLACGVVGAAVGSAFGQPGLGFAIGSMVGALLFPQDDMRQADAYQVGPRLTDLKVQSSAWGQMIPLCFGVVRVTGNLFWASAFRIGREEIPYTGPGAGKGGPDVPATVTREFVYASFAVGLAAAPTHLEQTFAATDKGDEIEDAPIYRDRPEIAGVRRIWLNGDLAYDVRTNRDKPVGAKLPVELFLGGYGQMPAEIIEAEEGVDQVPGYRGLAYLLFDKLDLTAYGNHLPNVSAEVIASLDRIEAEEGVEGLALGLDGDLWICCHTRRVVVRADPSGLRVKATIARTDPNAYLGDLPAHPWRIAVSPVTGLVWVVCLADRALAVIDPVTNAVAATIALAENYPHEITIGADGVPWVSFPLQNKVCRVDPGTHVQTYTDVTGAPHGLLRVGNELWVGCNADVKVLSLATMTVTHTLRVRTGSPDAFFTGGLAWSAKSNFVWAVSPGSDLANIWDAASKKPIATKHVGTGPLAISINQGDPWQPVWISTHYGNRLTAYTAGGDKLIAFGTISFPGPVLALADGRCLVANTKYDLVQVAEGR